jgi:hypothetical protein
MGIYDHEVEVFSTYEAQIVFEDEHGNPQTLMGGVPKDPEIIKGWLRSKAGVTEARELAQFAARTVQENGADPGVSAAQIAEMEPDEIYEVLDRVTQDYADIKATEGFKVDDKGLYIEERYIKAMLKESTNILFAKEKWGKTGKGPLGYVAERIFIKPSHLHLGRDEPDEVVQWVGHIKDASGKRSTLGLYAVVHAPIINFRVEMTEDAQTELFKEKRWQKIWVHAQRNGIGAKRSQGFGRFQLTKFERVA